jgi:hypothetical protein
MRSLPNIFARLIAVVLGAAALVGCRKEDMSEQPKFYKPYKESSMFADGTTARPIPAGTIARGHLQLEEDHYTGRVNGSEINYIPIPITRIDLERGQQKFMIYCSVCHGAVGDGNGMIVQRGMIRPPSLVRLDRTPTNREIGVQTAPIGHYFTVMTNGFGAMYSYNDRVAVDDRWRIAAYIRALQLSQDADRKMPTTQRYSSANSAMDRNQ